jgi:hypothetical protein
MNKPHEAFRERWVPVNHPGTATAVRIFLTIKAPKTRRLSASDLVPSPHILYFPPEPDASTVVTFAVLELSTQMRGYHGWPRA